LGHLVEYSSRDDDRAPLEIQKCSAASSRSSLLLLTDLLSSTECVIALRLVVEMVSLSSDRLDVTIER